MPVEVRDAHAGEVAALEALQLRSSLVWEDHRADLLARPEVIELPVAWVRAGWVRVAHDGDAVLGFSVVLPVDGEPTARELDGCFVEPDAMRRGVGRTLLSDAVAAARAEGATRLHVVANENALGFYERLGFVDEGEVQTLFGPGRRMTLAL